MQITILTLLYIFSVESVIAQNIEDCPNLSDSALAIRFEKYVAVGATNRKDDSIKVIFELSDSSLYPRARAWANVHRFRIVESSAGSLLYGKSVVAPYVSILTSVNSGDFHYYLSVFDLIRGFRKEMGIVHCGFIMQK